MKNKNFYCRLACVATICSMLLSICPYQAFAADKNNAERYEIGTTEDASVTEDSPELYYVFELEESGVVEATLKLDTWDAYSYQLLDDDGNNLYGERQQDHTGDLTWDLSAGTYYLRFYSNYGGYGTFSFSTSFKSADVNHDEDNAEKNNAAEISLNKKYNSIISSDKESEYFTFELEESGTVDAEIELGTWDAYSYQLLDDYGNYLYGERQQDHTGNLTWDLSEGKYYLRFYSNYRGYGTFSFTLSDGGTVADDDEDDSYEPVRTPSPVNDDHEDEDKDDTPVKTPVPDNGNDIYRPWESNEQNSEYIDVDKSDSYYAAVNELSQMGIINGYEDGSFGPDRSLTRAEFAKLVVVLLGEESEADSKKGYASFTDVNSDHWASGYINVAVDDGIINGYGGGIFGPEDSVTYAQAVKMLVYAAGYEQDAQTSGGWSSGYMAVGSLLGITDDISIYKESDDIISRGEAAILMYNTLAVIE